MQCPQCDIPLKKGDRAGVTLKYCGRCGGAWLDLFHLDLILYRAKPNGAPEPAAEGSERKIPAGIAVRRK
jgi:Zn-finger nucleic acid-binding protein